MIVARVLMVLASAFLVGAVGLAALTPRGITLNQALTLLDPESVTWLRDHALPWIWDGIELPLLVRPVWLLPAALGLVCAGLAASLNFAQASPSRRRRS